MRLDLIIITILHWNVEVGVIKGNCSREALFMCAIAPYWIDALVIIILQMDLQLVSSQKYLSCLILVHCFDFDIIIENLWYTN